ncbi:unnamed protein product [Brassica oleracea var. botrytis]|uniref:Uncharacterized protein n=1 Tax=Brassica oleracea TaxID=3712 RepID=A0A3P6GCS8_BRAOL|nr:unnamed protein product [Brassica oleracea]
MSHQDQLSQSFHFWEARNIANGGTFIGLELLLIDQQWEKVCSSRVITVLDWLKISGSAVDRVFELVSSEIVGFTVVVALIQNNLWEKIFVH